MCVQMKNLVALTSFLLFLIGVILQVEITRLATTESVTAVSVNPQEVRCPVGENFTIEIEISNVTDLYGWEVRLKWNVTVLEALEVNEGNFLKNGGQTFFTYKLNNTVGYVIADCTLLGDVAGVNGSGTLATIKFYTKRIGESPLDLYNTTLINSYEQSIQHVAVDGYYRTTVHDIALTNIVATKSWVNVTVENQGTETETFNVSVSYIRIKDPLIGTKTVTLNPNSTIILSFSWTPTVTGTYKITAQATILPDEIDTEDNIIKTTLYINLTSGEPSEELSITEEKQELLRYTRRP